MSFWKNYDAGPHIIAMGDQYDQVGEEFLDNLLADVRSIRAEYGEYPLPCLLAAELVKAASGNEVVALAAPLALGAAIVRLVKLEDGATGTDLSGLEFECDS